MKISKLLSATLALLGAFFIACGPAAAQWQVPNYSVPLGRGGGTGFKSAAPLASGVFLSTGTAVDPAFSKTLTLSPPSGLDQGLDITQTGTGTAVSMPFILGTHAYNGIYITQDNVDVGASGVSTALAVQNNISGAATQNAGRGAATFSVNVNGAVPTDGSFGGVTGVTSLAQSLYGFGGTGTSSATAKGSIYGFNNYAIAYGPNGVDWPGATNLFNVTGGEINVKIASGSGMGAYYKSGLQIVQLSDDAVQGTTYDAGLMISNMNGAVGWKNGIQFSNANGGAPVSTSGKLISTVDAFTADVGVDFSSGVTFTTGAFKSLNFLVNGTELALGTAGTARGQINFAGATSGNATLHAPAVAGGDMTLPQGSTTLAGMAIQQTWTAQQLFQVNNLTVLPSSGAGALVLNVGDGATVGTITFPQGTTDFSATGGSGQVVKQASAGGAFTVGTVSASDIASGAALTRTNDTNVTLTLGGSPTTAVLAATSLTVGWSGTLAASRGGFGANISASSGVPLFATGSATFTGTSGTGNFARVTSPTFVTPTLGVASGTSLTLSGTAAVGSSLLSGRTLVVGNSYQPTLGFWSTSGASTKQVMGLVYDAASALSSSGLVIQTLADDGSFASNNGVIWRDGSITIGGVNKAAVGSVKVLGYAVASLPTCDATSIGSHLYVTDATAPTFNATVAGGGAVTVPVFCDGSNWVTN